MTDTVERMLPLYEAKMIHQFDDRWATYRAGGEDSELVTLPEKSDPAFRALPRYWVREELVTERLNGDAPGKLTGWRDICRSTDERTMIAADFPTAAVGHTLPLATTGTGDRLLLAQWNSFVFDFVARQKVGGTHMTYSYLKQLPALLSGSLEFSETPIERWFGSRVAVLSSSESWHQDRRRELRAELDAACFHLYGVERDDVDYIMESFPIVKRKDVAEFGEFRTKRMILEVYEAISAGIPYASPFDSGDEVVVDA